MIVVLAVVKDVILGETFEDFLLILFHILHHWLLLHLNLAHIVDHSWHRRGLR